MNEQVFMYELPVYILFYQFFNVDELKYFLKFNNYMNLVAMYELADRRFWIIK